MSSIEWLEMQIVKLESKFAIPHAIYELCEKAKEMHKKETKNAYIQGRKDHYLDYYPEKHAEEYYNEKYKKD